MDFRIFTEPQQGATYDDLLRVAKAAEALEYNAFFRSDHYLPMNSEGLPGPTDAWITLAGLARETATIRLGTLVSSATFRYPGPFAISVAQVDLMSHGRVELGLGAGWYAEEHSAYGIPFPPVGERFDRFEEQLKLITGMWRTPADDTYSNDGTYYPIVNSPALPKPLQQPGPPIIIGGRGKKRTPELAAAYADEFNLAFTDLETTAAQFDRAWAACDSIARPREDLVMSCALVACCGDTEQDVARRAAAIGRGVDELRVNGAAGSPAELVDKIGTYGELGVSRIYLQVLDLPDLDHLELLATKVAAQL